MRRTNTDWVATALWAAVAGVVLCCIASQVCGGESLRDRYRALTNPTSPGSDLFEPYVPPDLDVLEGRVDEPSAQPLGDDGKEEGYTDLLQLSQALKTAYPKQWFAVFMQSNCPPCEAWKLREAPELVKKGFSIVYFKLDAPSGVAMAHYFGVSATPTIIAIDAGVEVSRTEGYAPEKECRWLFEPNRAPTARPPVQLQPPQRPQAQGAKVSCRQLMGQWTWPGAWSTTNLRAHLCSAPHNYSREHVYSLTPNQCVALHDSWHNSHGSARSAQKRMRRQRVSLDLTTAVLRENHA